MAPGYFYQKGMKIMTRTRLAQLWTDSVAYVALVTGAAVSIAGNVVDTSRTRGAVLDALDVVLAALFPALVVLMVEVFVSSRWAGLKWPMQVLRWAGCAGVTFVAMRISWVHLNDLMLSRGQEKDVAILGPLAIDFLAIMATALILAGRGRTSPVSASVEPAATQPIEPDTDWDAELRAFQIEAATVAPVSPAPVAEGTPRRAARATWDARRVAELALDGTPRVQIHESTQASLPTVDRFRKVARILQADPRASVDPRAEKISPEHVAIIRELVTR